MLGSVVVVLVQLALAVAVTPVLIGVMRTTRARLEAGDLRPRVRPPCVRLAASPDSG